MPDAVGRHGDARKAAVAALQVLVAGGQEATVRDVAAAYGSGVAAALDPLLGEDPRLAKGPPKAPAFWQPSGLPPVLLGDGSALPPEALETLRGMLALSEAARPLPGLREALAACDRRSLAAFGWELFEAWQRAGWPNDEKWAFSALGLLGDDDAVRKLTPLVRQWPGESAHAFALEASRLLDALRGRTVPSGKVLGLTSGGWSRGAPQDSGFVGWMARATSLGEVRLELEQGFIAGEAGANPEQTLRGDALGDGPIDAAALARLSAIEASEIAYSLSALIS